MIVKYNIRAVSTLVLINACMCFLNLSSNVIAQVTSHLENWSSTGGVEWVESTQLTHWSNEKFRPIFSEPYFHINYATKIYVISYSPYQLSNCAVMPALRTTINLVFYRVFKRKL